MWKIKHGDFFDDSEYIFMHDNFVKGQKRMQVNLQVCESTVILRCSKYPIQFEMCLKCFFHFVVKTMHLNKKKALENVALDDTKKRVYTLHLISSFLVQKKNVRRWKKEKMEIH